MLRMLAAMGCLIAWSWAAHATSYVLMSDGDLADRAAVIARVRIAGSAPDADGATTTYRAVVERAVKGVVAGEVAVRVPGSADESADVGLLVAGAPSFERGDRLLLFLVPDADRSYHVLHLLLGAFRVESGAGGTRVAVRDLDGGVELPGRSRATGQDRGGLRDADRFEAWLAARAARAAGAPDYFIGMSGGSRGARRRARSWWGKLRWFAFDVPTSIDWFSHRDGQPGLARGGHREFKRALGAWTRHDGSTVAYHYDGRTDLTGGLDEYDGVNTIVFERPLGDPFDCEAGGLLAAGGPWFDPRGRARFRGKRFVRILSADIAVNEGIACFFETSPDPRRAAEELFGHELGHTLGLGHSCGDLETGECDTPERDEALMRAFIHDDGRGAVLGAHDRAAICALYPRPELAASECAAP